MADPSAVKATAKPQLQIPQSKTIPISPSSADAGFFQAPPQVLPQYTLPGSVYNDDPTLSRLLRLYLPHPTPAPISNDLSLFASLILTSQVLAQTRNCETTPPTLHSRTSLGAINDLDPLRTSEGWRWLGDLGKEEGLVGLGFDQAVVRKGWNPRVWQFAKQYLWAGSAALVSCPGAMTDGVAVLLGSVSKAARTSSEWQDNEIWLEVAREVRERLVSRWTGEDDRGQGKLKAWTSGQWMTERTGGSDVRGTETVATRLSEPEACDGTDIVGMPLGPWSISGFKWFSSATDADAAVMLAQTSHGLSCFYAPMRLSTGRMNGVRISRLKDKLGTKGLPTAELELVGTRAWLVGEIGKGTKEISRVLNVTRIYTAVGQVGYWGRGLAVARAWARVRKVSGGGLLSANKQHVRWMAEETVKYRAAMALSFTGVALLGVVENGTNVCIETQACKAGIIPEDIEDAEMLLRVFTPVMKAQASLASIAGLRACMESLGGVGYLENNEDIVMNIARLFRDANVGAIWEGTTSVIAEDVLRVLKGRQGGQMMNVLSTWVRRQLSNGAGNFKLEGEALVEAWVAFETMIRETTTEELHWRGREVLNILETVLCSCLLMADSGADRDEIADSITRRWIIMRKITNSVEHLDWEREAVMDAKIFLGHVSMKQARL